MRTIINCGGTSRVMEGDCLIEYQLRNLEDLCFCVNCGKLLLTTNTMSHR